MAKTVKEDIRAAAKTMNIEGFLSKDFFKNDFNRQLLKGGTVGPSSNWKDINDNINEFLNTETLELYVEMENKVNTLIPEALVVSIGAFNVIQDRKMKLQDEIKQLEHEVILVENKESLTGQMRTMEIELEIDTKKQELETVKTEYFEAYRAALLNTQISEDLSVLVNEIGNIRNEYLEVIDNEKEMLIVKAKALDKLPRNLNLLDDLNNMIEARLNIGYLGAGKAVKSSEMKMPFIQTLVK